jgi:hypothetical protein
MSRRRRFKIADSIELKDYEVAGETIKITLASDFTFYAYVYGERIESTSMKGIEAAIKAAATREIVVAIEATIVNWGDDLTDVLITGRHNGNGNVLYREDKPGGKTEQIRSEERVCHRLSKAEREQYRSLVRKQNAAQRAVTAWPKTRKLDITAAIRGAVAAQRPVERVKKNGEN